MNRDFNYTAVPYGFEHCFNSKCNKSKHCLRHIAATHIEKGRPTIMIVNPKHIPENTSECSFFCSDQKVKVAWGIKNILNNVPYKEARTLKIKLFEHFGRSLYYRFQRKEVHIDEKQQEIIRAFFRMQGIEDEPEYEYYTEEYQW